MSVCGVSPSGESVVRIPILGATPSVCNASDESKAMIRSTRLLKVGFLNQVSISNPAYWRIKHGQSSGSVQSARLTVERPAGILHALHIGLHTAPSPCCTQQRTPYHTQSTYDLGIYWGRGWQTKITSLVVSWGPIKNLSQVIPAVCSELARRMQWTHTQASTPKI